MPLRIKYLKSAHGDLGKAPKLQNNSTAGWHFPNSDETYVATGYGSCLPISQVISEFSLSIGKVMGVGVFLPTSE